MTDLAEARREARRDAVRVRAVRQVKIEADALLLACIAISSPISIELHAEFDVALGAEPDSHHSALIGAIEMRTSRGKH